MEDAASIVAIMKTCKAEQEKEEKAQALSISKDEEEELLDTASTTSSVASGARPKTLSQMKSQHQQSKETEVPTKYIGHCEGISPSNGLYTCNYGDCDY